MQLILPGCTGLGAAGTLAPAPLGQHNPANPPWQPWDCRAGAAALGQVSLCFKGRV